MRPLVRPGGGSLDLTLVPAMLLVSFLLPVPKVGGRITFVVFDPDLSLDATILGLVGDRAVESSAFPASLVIDAFDCGGDDLEVLVSLEDAAHLRPVPQVLKQRP